MKLIRALAMTALAAALSTVVSAGTPLRLSPQQAVMNAAEMPGGVAGVFEMVVRATGRQGGLLYLNSERDYRDPRCLTIVVEPAQEKALADRLGAPVEGALILRTVAVRGIARKTRIDFLENGMRTGKYYYQTHLALRSARDLTVSGELPTP